jgi:ATPase subunit of ABC transporter with duplicated ATPase domains
MSSAVRALITAPGAQERTGSGRPRDTGAAPVDRVVALFSGGVSAPARSGDDWSASLTAVRGVAQQVRALQTSARDAIRQAHHAAHEAEARVRAAGARAEQAEGLLGEAIARAERAEAQARAAEERADRAEARTAEAHAWLRRMHECMVQEFGALAGAEAEA